MLRTPLRILYTKTVTSTASSSDAFTLPFQDFNGLVAKLAVSTLNTGLSGTLNVFVQTTDDAGTTYYDTVAFGQITETATMTNAAAQFAPIPLVGDAFKFTASDATLSQGSLGIPLLSNQVRVKWVYTNTGTGTAVSSWTISLLGNSQASYS